MDVEIVISENFKREAKKFLKKYVSLKLELRELIEELKENPKLGVKFHKVIYSF